VEIKSCFEELLRVLPEPERKEIVNERLSIMIGTLGWGEVEGVDGNEKNVN
jgi:hypothetical protein